MYTADMPLTEAHDWHRHLLRTIPETSKQRQQRLSDLADVCQRVRDLTGTVVHELLDPTTAYAITQTSDHIRPGDVLCVPAAGVVGWLDAAWPVALSVTDEHLLRQTGFHCPTDPQDYRTNRLPTTTATYQAIQDTARSHNIALVY